MRYAVSLALSVLSTPVLAGNVHIVGGAAATQPTVQAAVDAAVDGDVILVRSSGLAGFVVDGKSVSILGESAITLSSPIVIRNLAVGQECAIRSVSPQSTLGTLVTVHDCAGHVRLENLQLAGPGPLLTGTTRVLLQRCADVAIADSTITAGTNVNVGGTLGLSAVDSLVQLDASFVTGGFGGFVAPGSRPGGTGIVLLGGTTLFLQSSTVTGGQGGPGMSSPGCPFPGQVGGTGGAGIGATATDSVTIVETTVTGGAGGAGGDHSDSPPCSGGQAPSGSNGPDFDNVIPIVLAGPARRLSTPLLLPREQTALSVTVRGLPGESATLLISGGCQRAVVPTIQGPVLVGPGMRRLALGTIPAGGVLTAQVPFGNLPLGTLGTPRFLQAFCRDAGGQVRMSGCSSVAWIDSLL